MPAESVLLLHARPRALRHAGAVRGFAAAMSRLQRDPAAWRGAGLVAEHPPFARPICIPPAPVLGRASSSHLVTGGRIQPASWRGGGNPPEYPHRAQHQRWEPSAKGGVLGLHFVVCNLCRSWAGRLKWGKAPRDGPESSAFPGAGLGVLLLLQQGRE